MITVILTVIAVLASSAVVATARAVHCDGYRRVPTDPTRLP